MYSCHIDNVMPCCADCNYMKNNFDIYDFIIKIYNIYAFSMKKNKEFTDEELKLTINKQMTNIKNIILLKTT